MKKVLQLAAAVALTFTAVESNAQLANGSIAPDWTLSDILGVNHHLYADLDAGKTVYIDVSATWCGPCWAYHNTGALDALWVAHGPSGGTGVSGSTTNDCMVYFIEGDGTTGTNALHGIGGIDGTTQGDWTAGVSHPIIDPPAATINTFNSNYAIGHFPTIYMICPDRSITEVGQVNAAALYAAHSNCAIATAAVDAEMMLSTSLNGSLASCDSVTPTFRMGNIGATTLTSATLTYQVDGVTQKVYNWTGSIATYGNTTVTGIKVGSSTPGSHTINVIVSNPNGMADPTSANNATTASFIIYSTVGGAAVAETFEASGMPASWAISNGGDAATWMDATTGFSSSKSTTLGWYNIPSGDIDIFTLDPQSFGSFSSVNLTFEVSYCQYSSENDKLQVEVSTNCGTTWVSKYTKSGTTLSTHAAQTAAFTPATAADWRLETVNLNSVAGQSNVLVRFKGTSAYGNNIYVDNINVVGVTGINEVSNVASMNVYPNPMTNTATVDFNLTEASDVTITLVNALGQSVLTENLGNLGAGEQNYSLNAETLSNGLYFLNIKAGNGTITKKVSINK